MSIDKEIFPTGEGALLVHVWNADNQTWACAAYDHGPLCRLCQRVDEITWELLGLVKRGEMTMRSELDGSFSFRLTPDGEAHAKVIRETDPEMSAFYDRALTNEMEREFDGED